MTGRAVRCCWSWPAARQGKPGPTVHLVWSVQEEFNLRGVLPAATALQPDIALQIDLMLACDTPDMADRGEVALGGGPGISLYSFHGRGTLNGVIPHPALVRLMEDGGGGGRAALATVGPDRGADRSLLYPVHGAGGRGLPRCRLSDALFAFGAGGGAIWPILTALVHAAGCARLDAHRPPTLP